jgi:hypothetical protein
MEYTTVPDLLGGAERRLASIVAKPRLVVAYQGQSRPVLPFLVFSVF